MTNLTKPIDGTLNGRGTQKKVDAYSECKESYIKEPEDNGFCSWDRGFCSFGCLMGK